MFAKTFATNIHDYETYVYKKHNSLSLSTRDYLNNGAVSSMSHRHGDTAHNACSLLTAYRLVEIIAKLAGKCTPHNLSARRSTPPSDFNNKLLKVSLMKRIVYYA